MTEFPKNVAGIERELGQAVTVLEHIPHPHLARRRAAGPVTAADQLPGGSGLARFNTWLGVKITGVVGTMHCAYLFAALALISLPEAIRGGTSPMVQWTAQTFLQLVLLSIIMVGQRVQSAAGDARARATFDDGEAVLHYADGHAKSITQLRAELEQGLAHVHAKLDALPQKLLPAAAAAVPLASPWNQALDEHTAALLAKQLGQHLDAITRDGDQIVVMPTPGAAFMPPAAGTAPGAPVPAAPPVPSAPDPVPSPPPTAPPSAPPAPPADGTTGTGTGTGSTS